MGQGEVISVLYAGSTAATAESVAQGLEAHDERFRITPIAEETAVLGRLATGTFDCLVLDSQFVDQAGPSVLDQVQTRTTVPTVFHGENVETVIENDRLADVFTDYVATDGTEAHYSLLAHRIDNAVTRTDRRHRLNASEELRHKLTDIAGTFLTDPGGAVDRKIDDSLERVGHLADADRSYIFQIENQEVIHNTHEWTAQGVNPQLDSNQGFSTESLPWLLPQLRDFQPVSVPVVEDLPPEAATERGIFQSQNIESVVVVPMVSAGDLVGFIGLDWVDDTGSISPDVVDTLGLVGELITNAIQWETEQTRLREVTERWTLAQQAANLGVWDWDFRTDAVTFSENWAMMLGYDLNQIDHSLEAWKSRVHPADIDDVEAALAAHFDGDSAYYESDHRMRTADGDWLWTKSVGTVVERDDAGEPVRVVGIQQDISELKSRVAEIEQLSEFRRVMSEVNQQLVESRDPSVVLPRIVGTIASSDQFSRAIIHREGMEPIAAGEPTPAEGTADPLEDLDTQAYMNAVYEVGTLRLENVTEPPFQQRPAADPDASGFGFVLQYEGTRFGVLTVHLPAAEPASGDHLGLIEELAADIGLFLYTRSIEADLREREERLDLALDGAELGVWDWDMEENEVYRDPRYHRMLGYEPDEIGDTVDDWADLLHPDARENHDQALAKHIDGEADRYECDYRLRTADDEWKWIRNIGKVLEWEDGEPKRAVGVHQDIDEQRRTRERLRSNNELLQAIDRVLRHNLNNKMNVIQGYASTIADAAEGPVASQAERILESGRRLLETTDKERRIMDLVADPEATERLALAPMLDRVVDRLREQHPAATIELNVAELEVLAIPGLEGALEELIENGIEHAGRQAGTVTIQVRSESNGVAVTVADDGPGLPKMEQNVLTGTEEITPLYHGSGLGLWLINLVVKRSDGEITVTAAPDGGSRITIRLPQAS